MISAEVIKGVKEVLGEHGIHQQVDERFGDFVARGIGISARQSGSRHAKQTFSWHHCMTQGRSKKHC